MASNRGLEQASVLASPSKSHNYRIASLPAEVIGHEVVSAAIKIVEKLAKTLQTFTIEFTHLPRGTAHYKKTGSSYLDENTLETLKSFDAGLFGSVGAPGRCSRLVEDFL
jgi:isocitrate/isopropylmalate dehydrogenase